METMCIRKSDNATQTTTVTLHNVLHVPDLLKKGNHVARLMSQRAAHKTHNQYQPIFIDATDFSVIDVGHFYIPMDQHVHHNLLKLHTKNRPNNIPTESAFTAISNVPTTSRALWHKRLGHISPARLCPILPPFFGTRCIPPLLFFLDSLPPFPPRSLALAAPCPSLFYAFAAPLPYSFFSNRCPPSPVVGQHVLCTSRMCTC